MTDATQIVPIQRSSPYPPSETQALAAEVAKCLKLVATAGMNAEQQTVWLHSAVDALEGISASEVAAISAELRRSVTRPAQIVPEISKLVAAKRRRPAERAELACGCGAGTWAGDRRDAHWVRIDGETRIGWCP